jgi:hypothetical protein
MDDQSSTDAPAQQGTYLLSAAGLGPAPVFLVLVRQLADGLEYQAVFNRLQPAGRHP